MGFFSSISNMIIDQKEENLYFSSSILPRIAILDVETFTYKFVSILKSFKSNIIANMAFAPNGNLLINFWESKTLLSIKIRNLSTLEKDFIKLMKRKLAHIVTDSIPSYQFLIHDEIVSTRCKNILKIFI